MGGGRVGWCCVMDCCGGEEWCFLVFKFFELGY